MCRRDRQGPLTAAPTPTPRRGRPTREEAVALDERLRLAAIDAFVEHGFDGVTMEAIAAAAGVTKRTLYAKYPDKRTLFATVVPWALSRMPLADDVELPEGDLAGTLRAFARIVSARLVDPMAVKLRRLATLEAHRFPEFAHHANVHTYRENLQLLLQVLADHRAAGDIVIDDLQLAADQFLAMVAASTMMLADLGVFRSPTEEARHLDHAVGLFLSGVLPRPAP